MYWLIFLRIVELQKDGDYSKMTIMWPYYIAALTITSLLVSVAHWIFATQYLEVVLLLPLLLERVQANIEKKQQRARWVLNTVNTYFFVQVATWACFMLAYSDYEDLTGL